MYKIKICTPFLFFLPYAEYYKYILFPLWNMSIPVFTCLLKRKKKLVDIKTKDKKIVYLCHLILLRV